MSWWLEPSCSPLGTNTRCTILFHCITKRDSSCVQLDENLLGPRYLPAGGPWVSVRFPPMPGPWNKQPGSGRVEHHALSPPYIETCAQGSRKGVTRRKFDTRTTSIPGLGSITRTFDAILLVVEPFYDIPLGICRNRNKKSAKLGDVEYCLDNTKYQGNRRFNITASLEVLPVPGSKASAGGELTNSHT